MTGGVLAASDAAIAALVAAVASAAATLFVALRQRSGRVTSSESSELWDESRQIREYLRAHTTEIEAKYERIAASYDALKVEYDRLAATYDALKIDYDRLAATYDALKVEYRTEHESHSRTIDGLRYKLASLELRLEKEGGR